MKNSKVAAQTTRTSYSWQKYFTFLMIQFFCRVFSNTRVVLGPFVRSLPSRHARFLPFRVVIRSFLFIKGFESRFVQQIFTATYSASGT